MMMKMKMKMMMIMMTMIILMMIMVVVILLLLVLLDLPTPTALACLGHHTSPDLAMDFFPVSVIGIPGIGVGSFLHKYWCYLRPLWVIHLLGLLDLMGNG